MPKLKGNLLAGQSGGPTAVINASLYGVVKEALRWPEIAGIYGMLHGIQGLLKEELIDLKKQNPETIEKLKFTPGAALGSCRYKLKEEEYEKILDILKRHNIRYLHYIGGNDSQDTSNRISKFARRQGYELRVIGVPKTIDNDLVATDHCPGYGSVSRFIASVTRDAGLDTQAIGIVDKVKVIEAMGRNAGWITASSALAKQDEKNAPHLIYLPESPLSLDKFLSDVQKVYDRLGHAVVVVCEGVKGEDGQPLSASGKTIDLDAFGHKQMGGVADFLCRQIAGKLKLKARFDKPGTIQRVSMALVSEVDLEEAEMVGRKAVEEAVSGKTDYMITLVRESNTPYRCTTGLAKLEAVASAEKLVPEGFINKEHNFITDKFIEYARPLIGKSLPEYAKLNEHVTYGVPTESGQT